jgi:hypothetical protein
MGDSRQSALYSTKSSLAWLLSSASYRDLFYEDVAGKFMVYRECDIVETLHMRLTLLQMTFGKHIERKHICFFPGEVNIYFVFYIFTASLH